ncbi:MAG: hypothetical protein EON52_03960 [Actinomycetales bacterium]|nr:MAG: hypothetical protein EON52_03960 [Actinomycetales bacterium]
MSDHDSVLQAWVVEVSQELGLTVETDVETLLDLAGTAAHAVVRPAAPLTTFLAGAALAQGRTLEEVVAAVERVVAARDSSSPDPR